MGLFKKKDGTKPKAKKPKPTRCPHRGCKGIVTFHGTHAECDTCGNTFDT